MYRQPEDSVRPDIYQMGMHPWRTPIGRRGQREIALSWVSQKSVRLELPEPEHLVRQMIVDALAVGTDVYVIGDGEALDVFDDVLLPGHRARTAPESLDTVRRALSTRHGLPVLLVIVELPGVTTPLAAYLEQYANTDQVLDLRLVTCGRTGIPVVDDRVARSVSLRTPDKNSLGVELAAPLVAARPESLATQQATPVELDAVYSVSDADITEALETSPASIRAAARRAG